MCVIIRKKANAIVCPSVIRNAFENNRDGFGLMYSKDGEIQVIKGLLNLKEIFEVWNAHMHLSIAVHLRHATVGDVTEDNLHPIQLLNKQEDGQDVWLMHNGTIRDVKPTGGQNDTAAFTEMLRGKIRQGGGWTRVMTADRRKKLGDAIGKSKLLFMRGDGETCIINRELGIDVGDTWFSNAYSLSRGYRDSQPATALESWLDEAGKGYTVVGNHVTTTHRGRARN